MVEKRITKVVLHLSQKGFIEQIVSSAKHCAEKQIAVHIGMFWWLLFLLLGLVFGFFLLVVFTFFLLLLFFYIFCCGRERPVRLKRVSRAVRDNL